MFCAKPSFYKFSFPAKTRMKMLTTVTAMKALPHTQLDNQQTAFDSVRLVSVQSSQYKKNDRRNSGGTLRQKFNLIDF